MPNNHINILIAEGDVSHVPNGDRSPLDPFDDHCGNIFRSFILTHSAGNIPTFSLVKVTGADVSILYIQGTYQFRNCDVTGS